MLYILAFNVLSVSVVTGCCSFLSLGPYPSGWQPHQSTGWQTEALKLHMAFETQFAEHCPRQL